MDSIDPQHYLNRELSWLEFNSRVLSEALDSANPLLERFKFLGIVSSNLDEFLIVRAAGLLQLVEAGLESPGPDGLTPAQQLEAVRLKVREMFATMEDLLADDLIPALRTEGIDLLLGDEARKAAKAEGEPIFEQDLLPVLTPVAIDQGHPLPTLLADTIYLFAHIDGAGESKIPKPQDVIIQVPTTLSRFVRLDDRDGRQRYVALGDIMSAHLRRLYPEAEKITTGRFRLLRDSDFAIDEEGAEDLLKAIETALIRRKQRAPVRLEYDTSINEEHLKLLIEELELESEDLRPCHHLVDFSSLMAFAGQIDRPDLKDKPRKPLQSLPPRDEKSIFDIVKDGDRVLYHPYESFEPVERMVSEGADDPNTLAIKITLYRTSAKSPIIAALERASQRGVHVTALVELKARFDEERNIEWARRLERAGAHVIYGLVGFKTHSKAMMVVRRESAGIRRYLHLATGNYNSSTARLYTDVGLLTCHEGMGAEVAELFNTITGYTRPTGWHLIMMAPLSMRQHFITLIRREAENAEAGRPARIIAKMNSLVDPEAIAELYKAAQAGVEIDLIVRGICCLRPGVKGLSENIRVRSIVGRYLEHARIFNFSNGGRDEYYIGSADWMPRNFDRRIELAFPIMDKAGKSKLREILELQLSDNQKAHLMQQDGSYKKAKPKGGAKKVNSQEAQYRLYRDRMKSDIPEKAGEVAFRPSVAPTAG